MVGCGPCGRLAITISGSASHTSAHVCAGLLQTGREEGHVWREQSLSQASPARDQVCSYFSEALMSVPQCTSQTILWSVYCWQ